MLDNIGSRKQKAKRGGKITFVYLKDQLITIK